MKISLTKLNKWVIFLSGTNPDDYIVTQRKQKHTLIYSHTFLMPNMTKKTLHQKKSGFKINDISSYTGYE